MFATTLNMVPRELELDGTNVHLYRNHIERFIEQFSRSPRALPQLEVVNKRDKLEDYVWEDFILTGYDPHAFIKYDVSI
jgi:thymidylate synthase